MTCKFHIVTIGCQMNLYDTSIYADFLIRFGFEETNQMEDADVILINTCAVRQKSVDKAISYIGQASKFKRKKPGTMIGVIGCASSLEKDSLKNRFPVNFIFGALNDTRVPDLFQETIEQNFKNDTHPEIIPFNSQLSQFVPVTFGCDSFCSYCIVPYVRGRERSIPETDILETIDILAKKGIKEITLLGQNVNHYGRDLGLDYHFHFPDLLLETANHPLIQRVDFLTSHPKDFDYRIIDVIQQNEKIYRHFHLPIQSGDNGILKQMNRGYTIEEYLRIIETIRKSFQNVSLSTDLIVGFPGETETAFENSLEVIRQVNFDMVYGAVYSPRPGTKAEKLPNRIPLAEGKNRINKVLEIQREIANRNNNRYIGMQKSVFVSEIKEDGSYIGKTIEEKPIHFVSKTDINLGDIVTLRITSFEKHSLRGEMIDVF